MSSINVIIKTMLKNFFKSLIVKVNFNQSFKRRHTDFFISFTAQNLAALCVLSQPLCERLRSEKQKRFGSRKFFLNRSNSCHAGTVKFM